MTGTPPCTPGAWQALTPARQRAHLSLPQLYLRYIALGGLAPARDFAAHCSRGVPLRDGEHDLAVLALNERFLELGAAERLPYERAVAPE